MPPSTAVQENRRRTDGRKIAIKPTAIRLREPAIATGFQSIDLMRTPPHGLVLVAGRGPHQIDRLEPGRDRGLTQPYRCRLDRDLTAVSPAPIFLDSGARWHGLHRDGRAICHCH